MGRHAPSSGLRTALARAWDRLVGPPAAVWPGSTPPPPPPVDSLVCESWFPHVFLFFPQPTSPAGSAALRGTQARILAPVRGSRAPVQAGRPVTSMIQMLLVQLFCRVFSAHLVNLPAGDAANLLTWMFPEPKQEAASS